ncbi:MAG TPA: DUF4294 domain-containing protein [Bacteroidia bacterium]|nr:DUF4294 domain-containing protein [Bacteroidia bacterium]HNS12989.1 DUF4294 domain-containing protein [Bacteroidia bacterium]
MRYFFFLSLLMLLDVHEVFCQTPLKLNDDGSYRLPYIVEGEDTVPVVNLPMVDIIDMANPDYLKDLQAYYRLRYNVIKVYPYARLAAVKLNEMEAKMSTMKGEREKRKYRKSVEEQVRKDFEEQIKKLSINQGDVLIKLIDRETGHSSYDLISQLKGSLNAFFSQSIARLFGHNLKTKYDPEGDDKTIEMIVNQIETGKITF